MALAVIEGLGMRLADNYLHRSYDPGWHGMRLLSRTIDGSCISPSMVEGLSSSISRITLQETSRVDWLSSSRQETTYRAVEH